jgi:hypothetical protein
VNDDTVGAVRSIVTVAPVEAEAGPVFDAASLAAPTASCGMTVPALQPVIVTVRELPASAPGSNTHEVAVPVCEKSPAATPVTASENVRVYEIDDAFVGVEVTAVNDETVGAVVSRVIVGPSAIAAGPVLPAASVAPFAAKCGMIVPAEQLVSVTVRVAPVSAPGANTQPVAVPVCVKSPAATPVTDSENVSVYEIDDALVGVDVTAVSAAVGAVRSIVIVVLDVEAEAGPVLPAASVAPPDANTGITVPSPQLVIVTVRDVPESVPGENEQPDAVPEFEKSPAATPVTDSENVTVYENDAAFVGDAWALVKVDTVGAVVSITIAFAPAMLFVPVGTVVDVIALPAVSATVPIVKLDTVRSAEFCAAATV